ncbi:RagB/SusD family nutrient uptake outer membrane protein [Flavobacterium ardleyense]|uniref:RagB/SusD family nutrient uptake outer membrane protein n=1 Tax=Flavobacterium ardleyense TaxID=2038737 RepID=A0ABW5Z5K8_9FLAO
MKNIKYEMTFVFAYCLLVVSALCLLYSCDDFVSVDLPSNQLTGEAVFEDVATADAALAHIYAQLRHDVLVTGTSNGLSCLMGNYADELDYYSSGNLPALHFNQNNLLATNSTVGSIWKSTYNLIYASNAVIEGVLNSGSLSATNKSRLLGEAYFIRAYLHFYLVNLYGEIPYVVSTDYKVNTTISKLAVSDVYSKLTTDLQQAISSLPATYAVAGRAKPNKSTAHAFLSRVKLYSGQWSEAAFYADEVIGTTSLYNLPSTVTSVFLKTSTGTLWQLMPQTNTFNTFEAQTFIFVTGPPPTYALTDGLVSSFEVGDLRRTNWIGTVTSGAQSWYYPNKYKERVATGPSVENSILFRLEELYLIRAEANAQLDNLTSAQDDLNVIRNRAGLSNTLANTKTALLEAIQDERRKEFFTELGHRWFDLKRTGMVNSVLSGVKPGWDATDILLPLPSSELLLNSNLLPQNPGY